jgi:hypothetical protein
MNHRRTRHEIQYPDGPNPYRSILYSTMRNTFRCTLDHASEFTTLEEAMRYRDTLESAEAAA